MSKKDRKQADADLDKLLEESVPKATFSPSLLPIYIIPAVLASAAPAYLFYAVHQLNGPEYYPLYLLISLVTAVILILAYHNTKTNVHIRLLSSRPSVHTPIGERNAEKQKKAEVAAEAARSATGSEAGAFAVLYNTLLFVGSFVLLGAFLLARFLPATYNYPASSVLAAGLVFAASKAK